MNTILAAGTQNLPNMGYTNLTVTEIKILEILKTGLSNKEIGTQLSMKEKTVKFHLTNVYKKLKVSGDRQLLSQYINKGGLS